MSKSALALFITMSLCVVSLAQSEVTDDTIRISSVREIGDEFKNVPCKNEERQAAVKALFERMGANPADIKIDKYKKIENVSVTIPGESQDKIVIGAHYDKVKEGCGAIDNWTGVVAIAHLYRAFKDHKPRKTLVFVGFDQEEKGLLGSRAMVEAIPKDKIAEYCSMVNIDALGMTSPQVFKWASVKQLVEPAKDVADGLLIPFTVLDDERGTSDSLSFIKKRIAGVTISGMSYDWPTYLHSDKDQASEVDPQSVYLGYRVALGLIYKLDKANCSAYSIGNKTK